MALEKRNKSREINTFAARNLHETQKKPSIHTFMESGIRSEYSLSAARRRRMRMFGV